MNYSLPEKHKKKIEFFLISIKKANFNDNELDIKLCVGNYLGDLNVRPYVYARYRTAFRKLLLRIRQNGALRKLLSPHHINVIR